ncbi:MAG: hypothetical protein KDE35_18500, partial [Geminicoccaceae bacterium]|nr:hypothetical protein [Geminicoccaceae bacterium]
QGFQIACPEEIAFNQGWIDEPQLRELAAPLAKTAYGRYLTDVVLAEDERSGAPATLALLPSPRQAPAAAR